MKENSKIVSSEGYQLDRHERAPTPKDNLTRATDILARGRIDCLVLVSLGLLTVTFMLQSSIKVSGGT